MSHEKEAVRSIVILTESSQNPGSDELAEGSTGPVNVLTVAEVVLVFQELGPVHEQTVN